MDNQKLLTTSYHFVHPFPFCVPLLSPKSSVPVKKRKSKAKRLLVISFADWREVENAFPFPGRPKALNLAWCASMVLGEEGWGGRAWAVRYARSCIFVTRALRG